MLPVSRHMSRSWQPSTGAAWRRWQRFAHRAAEVQSRVVLFLLYFAFVTPIALVMRIATARRMTTARGTWHPVRSAPVSLDSAKDQF